MDTISPAIENFSHQFPQISQQILQCSLKYSITVISAQYLTLKLSFWSQNNSYCSTDCSLTPQSWNPEGCSQCLAKKGSKFIPPSRYYSEPPIQSLLKKKSMLIFYSHFYTCRLILSTDQLRTLKTLTVPSTSMILLPIAIIMVPRKIHDFSSISGLIISGVMKLIFSNSTDSFDVVLSQVPATSPAQHSSGMIKSRKDLSQHPSIRLNLHCGQNCSLRLNECIYFYSYQIFFCSCSTLRWQLCFFLGSGRQCLLQRLSMGFVLKKSASKRLHCFFYAPQSLVQAIEYVRQLRFRESMLGHYSSVAPFYGLFYETGWANSFYIFTKNIQSKLFF